MKKSLLIALVGGMLLVPSTAQAKTTVVQPAYCWCVHTFTNQFTSDTAIGRAMRARWDSNFIWTIDWNKIKILRQRGIYDVERDGYINNGWCQSHKKLCKAAIACLIAAGGTTLLSTAPQSPGHGRITTFEALTAVNACTTAAIGAMVT